VGLLVIWVFGIYQVSKGHITVGVLTCSSARAASTAVSIR
jgi:ABC-type bacteriocin/lantibiotic exporter with double-glycine peptidase domain